MIALRSGAVTGFRSKGISHFRKLAVMTTADADTLLAPAQTPLFTVDPQSVWRLSDGCRGAGLRWKVLDMLRHSLLPL